MHPTTPVITAVLLAACSGTALAQAAAPDAADKGKIGYFLAYFAPTDVSAAGFLGLSGDAVTVVENPKGLGVALSGLGTAGSSLGLSITPARTAWAPMSMTLGTYKASRLNRLLGASTFSYAQGSGTVAGVDLQRRALAYSTHLYFNAKEDPVLAGLECPWTTDLIPPGTSQAETERLLKKPNADFLACVSKAQAAAQKNWNAARLSLALGRGWVRPADGSGSVQSLGSKLSFGMTYGFDAAGLKMMASAVASRTTDAPVLKTLVTGPLQTSAKSLAGLRLTGGSDTLRTHVEASRSSSSDVSASERVFRQALGLDYRLSDGLWLGLRAGKMRKVDGQGQEAVTLATVNFSPKSTLP